MPKTKRRLSPAEVAAQLDARREKEARVRAAKRDAERRPEGWGVNVEAQALPSNADVTGQNRQGAPTPVRKDVFGELWSRRRVGGDRALSTSSLHFVRRLEDAMVARLGLGMTPDATGGRGFGPRTLVNDRMLQAGADVDAVLAMLAPGNAALLCELLEPARVHTSAPQRWRLVVALLTGVKGEAAQASRVRAAADDLAECWPEMERRRLRQNAA